MSLGHISFFLLLLLLLFFFYFRSRFHFNPNPDDGGLFICCGQLVGKRGGPRHSNCPGSNSGYHVGRLFLEMEFCPYEQGHKSLQTQKVTFPIRRKFIGRLEHGFVQFVNVIL